MTEEHHCELLDRHRTVKIAVDLVYDWSLLLLDAEGRPIQGVPNIKFCLFCGDSLPQRIFKFTDVLKAAQGES